MQNISGAMAVCSELGIDNDDFYKAISSFKGASKRLQLLAENSSTKVFLDFAHSPSKVSATVKALKEAFPHRELVACLELHTFSSLNPNFLGEYKDTMLGADFPIVYFNPETLQHKKLPPINPEEVARSFGNPKPIVFTDSSKLIERIKNIDLNQKNLLIMTSGNFSGVNLRQLASSIV
jgi:UDP-N-acetylmuramate: L-alanyl-gamma-D-glutamyl-meso-diaminopimelate ligase